MTGSTKRPRRCAVCHIDATHIEVTTRPACTIARDGTVRRYQEQVGTYYCGEHTGVAAMSQLATA